MQKDAVCYELTLTPSYVADWDFNDAIRELIQNGIDQETTDSNNKFKLEYDFGRNVIRLISPKSKLNINTLLLGKTSKANDCNTVGKFGEGYKIAALVLNRLNKSFTIYNNNASQIWESRFKNSEKWKGKILAFYISKSIPKEDGLIIEVGNVSEDEYYGLSDIWLGFGKNDSHIKMIKTKYGDILPEYNGRVFVSGLAISYNGTLEYGYNFKPQYIKLERDRKTCDSWNAKIITTKMISEALVSGKIEPEIVRKMVEEDCDDVYQMDIISDNEYVKRILIEEFDKENTKLFSIPVGSEEQSKRVRSLGGNPVFVQHRVASILEDETNRRIEELSNSPISNQLTLRERFMRWIAVYQDNLCESAIEEFEKLVNELE